MYEFTCVRCSMGTSEVRGVTILVCPECAAIYDEIVLRNQSAVRQHITDWFIRKDTPPQETPTADPPVPPPPEPVHDWHWACDQLVANRKMRSRSWEPNLYLAKSESFNEILLYDDCHKERGGTAWTLTRSHLSLTDWELYEVPAP